MEIKVPFYNIVNMLLTGLVFWGGIVLIFPQKAFQFLSGEFYENLKTGPEFIFIICLLAVTYETGLVINRVGSVIIEPILKKAKLIHFNDDYALFNQAKKEHPIMSTLSREFALSRTSFTLFLLLAFIAIFNKLCILFLSCITISFVFYLSCKKHSSKIVELMKDQKNNSISNKKVDEK